MIRAMYLIAQCRLLLAMSLVCAAQLAYSQARPTASGPGSFIAVGGGGSIYQSDYGKQKLAGGFVVGDVNFTWRYGVEAEARFLNLHSSEQVKESNYLVGPRIMLRSGDLQPYVKALIGVGNITFPFDYAHGSFLTYAPGAGVDYSIGDRLIVRVVDFEYQIWPEFSFSSLRPYGVSTGLVIRLNAIDRYPRRRR
jgi:hypothetical protein